jgi:hypothetical protein
MSSLLVRNAEVLVTMDEGRRELKEAGLYAEEGYHQGSRPQQGTPPPTLTWFWIYRGRSCCPDLSTRTIISTRP